MDNPKQFTAIEWCAGYGGIHLGLARAIPNLRVIAYGEIEAFACANLVSKMEAGLMDKAPIWSDIKTFPAQEFRDRVDLLVAGYPCQPFSAAGKRLGTEDPRHLWPHIAGSIRVIRPRFCFFENVEGHISLGLSSVISDLEELGYKVSWGIFSAREVGAPHQRKRVFILANLKCAGLEGFNKWNPPSEQTQLVGADSGASGQRSAWPSGPGEPQHGWEPPRVVGGLAHPASQRGGSESGDALHEGRPTSETGRESLPQDARWQNGAAIPDNQPTGGDGAELGNAESRQDHGREPRDMGGEAGQGRCGDHAVDGTGEAMGNANIPRSQERQRQRGAGIQGTHADGGEDAERQAEPPLGGDPDGPAGGLDYAELCVACDNRTDELRLLGNGVVPATAERAFRTLLTETNTPKI